MKQKFLLVLVLFVKVSMGQINEQNITGQYSLGSSSPEGGSSLIIMEQGTYAIAYFGGIQVGKWKFLKDGRIEFAPFSKPIFELYGRTNRELKKSAMVSFENFENGDVYAGFHQKDEPWIKLNRVFNEDANCFAYPYVYNLKRVPEQLIFMFKIYYPDKNEVRVFNNNAGYNDFIVINNSHTYLHSLKTMTAVFNEGMLTFEDGKTTVKRDLDENSEDMLFLKQYISQVFNDVQKIYVNKSYNLFEGNLPAYYEYDKKNNIFIDTQAIPKANKGGESSMKYDDFSKIYEYKKLKEKVSTDNFETNNSSLFIETCD
ncbi:hypothetical protein [Abyssalbus ytuae]|uniref:Uncharacterized protein n=1 Tax=Abyssalbus ytuae TaxID=2926907 RepID=A0A9E7D105_9FLAO|nr:hypothetical protein [Abyssalbus ytuae]UOB18895.1 hypothetical protein MQE35_06255 [Abyssalbus ytuae]